jgi:hypothetical protein
LIKPAGKGRFLAQVLCFSGEDDEYRQGDLLGGVGIARFADGGGIDQVDVARHQRRKRRFRILPGIFTEQFLVSPFLHLLINVRGLQKVPSYFWERRRCADAFANLQKDAIQDAGGV